MTKEQIYQKEYKLKNKEKLKEQNKEYRELNKEKLKQWKLNNKEKFNQYQKEYQKEYRLNNKEKFNQYQKVYILNNKEKNNLYQKKYQKERRLIDPLYKLRCNIRSNIHKIIKRMGYSKKTKTFKILGCSFEEFKTHLEAQFTKGMNWSNAGEWHLDHIYPVSLAKDEEELIRLNHYNNFQPLWAIDNLKKGNKIIDNKQLKLI